MKNNIQNVKQTPVDMDLNTAALEDLERLPAIGNRERAMAVINARPLTKWEQVAHIEGFGKKAAEDLQRAGAQLGRQAA